MLSNDAGKGIDGRYPAQTRQIGWFLGGYPIAVVVGTIFTPPYAIVFAGTIAGLCWLGLLANFVVTELQRAGYKAALEDFTLLEMARLGLEGKLPTSCQAIFDGHLPGQGSKQEHHGTGVALGVIPPGGDPPT